MYLLFFILTFLFKFSSASGSLINSKLAFLLLVFASSSSSDHSYHANSLLRNLCCLQNKNFLLHLASFGPYTLFFRALSPSNQKQLAYGKAYWHSGFWCWLALCPACFSHWCEHFRSRILVSHPVSLTTHLLCHVHNYFLIVLSWYLVWD